MRMLFQAARLSCLMRISHCTVTRSERHIRSYAPVATFIPCTCSVEKGRVRCMLVCYSIQLPVGSTRCLPCPECSQRVVERNLSLNRQRRKRPRLVALQTRS
ncbi:hypothetical protein BKA62DRAFT_733646, partial [Auriculariales sp. MPI-PUGE-AT-0066]